MEMGNAAQVFKTLNAFDKIWTHIYCVANLYVNFYSLFIHWINRVSSHWPLKIWSLHIKMYGHVFGKEGLQRKWIYISDKWLIKLWLLLTWWYGRYPPIITRWVNSKWNKLAMVSNSTRDICSIKSDMIDLSWKGILMLYIT